MCKIFYIHIYSEHGMKKIKLITCSLILALFVNANAEFNSEKECFENISRGVFNLIRVLIKQ